MTEGERLVEDLMKTALGQPIFGRARVRIAVTVEEFEHIRQFMFKRDGVFYSQIRGVPLVVEDHPAYPMLKMEYAPCQTKT